MSSPLSPVLLIGAGSGEATCGILYIASYLRRNGIEAYVRLTDADETEEEIAHSLERLIAMLRITRGLLLSSAVLASLSLADEPTSLKAHKKDVTSVSVSSDGKFIASGSDEDNVPQ